MTTLSPVFMCFDGGTTPQVLLRQKYLNLWVFGLALGLVVVFLFRLVVVFFLLAADRVVFFFAADRVFFLAAFFFLTAIRILPFAASVSWRHVTDRAATAGIADPSEAPQTSAHDRFRAMSGPAQWTW